MKHIETYRGAKIFEDELADAEEVKAGKFLYVAKGIHPSLPNMRNQFTVKATTKKEALKQIKSKINRYLEAHNMNAFD